MLGEKMKVEEIKVEFVINEEEKMIFRFNGFSVKISVKARYLHTPGNFFKIMKRYKTFTRKEDIENFYRAVVKILAEENEEKRNEMIQELFDELASEYPSNWFISVQRFLSMYNKENKA